MGEWVNKIRMRQHFSSSRNICVKILYSKPGNRAVHTNLIERIKVGESPNKVTEDEGVIDFCIVLCTHHHVSPGMSI